MPFEEIKFIASLPLKHNALKNSLMRLDADEVLCVAK